MTNCIMADYFQARGTNFLPSDFEQIKQMKHNMFIYEFIHVFLLTVDRARLAASPCFQSLCYANLR